MRLYFRIKDNGASVFRLVEDPARQRLDLKPIAEANHRNGAVKPRPNEVLTSEESAEIEAWLADRRDTLARRENAAADRAVEAMNAAAHWLSGKPDLAAADASTEQLLLAMHDLRGAIVRYKAERASIAAPDGANVN